MKKLKIAMAGPSGVGKTTLCKKISGDYDIPFITTSTKPLWEKYDIQSHEQLITRTMLNPQWGLDFQYELLAIRQDVINNEPEFITDRSPIDNVVYFLMQNTPHLGEEATRDYIKLCTDALANLDGVIQIPFTEEIILENDGKRVANKYYQMSVNAQFHLASNLIALGLPPKGNLRVTTLPMWNWEERLNHVRQFIAAISEV